VEPRNDESQKMPEPRQPKQKRRFQIVKLEERIAPSKGGNSNGHGCNHYHYSRPYRC
jgi:hypothetical protein